LLLVLLACASPQTRPAAQQKALVFTRVTVIDATGAPAKPDATVVIVEDRITDVGQAGSVRIPSDAQVVNAQGKFLIPGLWDMHIHWFGNDKRYLELFIINGVTGARVMWGAPIHFEWRREIQEGAFLGPRMVIASSILDGPNPVWPGSIAVGNETEAREAVRKSKQDGADFVKVYSLLPRQAYFAIADESRKQRLPFVGHVPNSVSAGEASDAGQKSIEHLTGVLAACSTQEEAWRKEALDAYSNLPQGQRVPSPERTRPLSRLLLETFSPEKATALFTRLKQNHTWQCPTLVVSRSFAFLNDPSFRDDKRLKYMPSKFRAMWDPNADFRVQGRTSEDYDLSRAGFRKSVELVGLMRRAGVEFLAGTDVGNPYVFPGFSLHDELALLVQAGLTPMEAVQAATLNAARFLGNEKDFGTIEKGKIADLVLLEGNPLEDITHTQKINAVVLGGRLLPKPELQQMLVDVEALAKSAAAR